MMWPAALRNALVGPSIVLCTGLLWVIGVAFSSLHITKFGIVSSFSAIFWFSLLVASFAYLGIVLKRSGKLTYLPVLYLIFLTSFWLIPPLMGATQPQASQVWVKGGSFTTSILSGGHFDALRVWYHSWPAAWIFIAFLQQVLGFQGLPGELALSSVAPMIIQVTLSIVLFSLFQALWGGKLEATWLSLLFFLQGSGSIQNYVSPQVIGLLLFFTLVLVLFRWLFQNEGGSRAAVVMFLLLVAGIAADHPITLLFTLASLTSFYIVLHAPRLSTSLGSQAHVVGIVAKMLPPAFAISIAWNVWSARAWLQQSLPSLLAHLFSTIGLGLFAERVISTEGPHAIIVQSRVLYSAVWLTFGIAGILMMIRRRTDSNPSVALMGGVSVGLTLASLAMGGAVFEAIDRLLFFLMVPLAFFVGEFLFDRRLRGTLLVLICFAPVMFFVAHYGDQKAEHFRSDYVAAVRFFNDHAVSGTVTAWRGLAFSPFGGLSMLGSFDGTSFDEMRSLISRGALPSIKRPHYVPLTSLSTEASEFMGTERDSVKFASDWLRDNENYGVIYGSRNGIIYLREH